MMLRIHDTLRDVLILMVRSADLTVQREPHDLLKEGTEDRPADLFIMGWEVDGVTHRDHAVDLTCPLVDTLGMVSRSWNDKRTRVLWELSDALPKRSNVLNLASKQNNERAVTH